MTNIQEISPKSGLATFICCFFFGFLGIHRFYVGKIGTGILMLITVGGFGFWMLYDIFSIVCKNFTDSEGRTVEIAKNPTAPRNIIIVVICFYIVLFGLIMMLVGATMRDLKSVGKNELSALREGKIEQAYSYTSSEFQKGVSVETFKKFVDSYPQLHDNVDSTFTKMEFKDNDGLITGTLTLKDGSTTAVEIVLLKENNQWKINGITLPKVNAQNTNSAPATIETPATEPKEPATENSSESSE